MSASMDSVKYDSLITLNIVHSFCVLASYFQIVRSPSRINMG
jgi:hypothetical protein